MSIIDKFKALPKESRQSIILMLILCVMFIIGIIVRWDYIKEEVTGTVNGYVEMFNQDSLRNR